MSAPVPGWPSASQAPVPAVQPANAGLRGNPGRILAGIILVGALIWILGPARAGTTGSPATSAQSVAEAPIALSGTGTKNTPPFTLAGGNYTVSWTAQASSAVGCYHGAHLEPVSGSGGESIGSGLFDDAAMHSDTTNLYGVEPGQYFVLANSGCAWTITITP